MEKEINVISAKYLFANNNTSGVTLLYISPAKGGFTIAGVYSAVISTEDAFNMDLSGDILGIIKLFYSIRSKYGIIQGTDQKIHDAITRGISADNISKIVEMVHNKDNDSISYEIQKIIAAALASDESKFAVETSMESPSAILFNDAYERLQSLTNSRKIDIASPLYENDRAKAELSLNNNINDISVIALTGKGVVVFIFVNNQTGRFLGFKTNGIDPDNASSMRMNVIDLFNATKKIENVSLNKMLKTLTTNAKPSIFIPSSPENIDEITENMKKIGLNDLVCINYDVMNCIIANSIFQISEDRPEANAHETEAKGVKKTIGVALLLSPTKGKRLTELLPGNIINVLLDKDSPIGMKFIKNLNLLEDNKVKPIGAEVYAVKRDAKNGFTVYVKITHDLYGKAYEEQDVRIKSGDPEVDDMVSRSNRSLTIGLLIGFLVIVIGIIIMLIL